jgi:hypothetical protein
MDGGSIRSEASGGIPMAGLWAALGGRVGLLLVDHHSQFRPFTFKISIFPSFQATVQ